MNAKRSNLLTILSYKLGKMFRLLYKQLPTIHFRTLHCLIRKFIMFYMFYLKRSSIAFKMNFNKYHKID
jgi:hypothetical protein